MPPTTAAVMAVRISLGTLSIGFKMQETLFSLGSSIYRSLRSDKRSPAAFSPWRVRPARVQSGAQFKHTNRDVTQKGVGDALHIIAPDQELIDEGNKTQVFNDTSYVVLYRSAIRTRAGTSLASSSQHQIPYRSNSCDQVFASILDAILNWIRSAPPLSKTDWSGSSWRGRVLSVSFPLERFPSGPDSC